MKRDTFTFYNKFLGTLYRVIFSVHTCLSFPPCNLKLLLLRRRQRLFVSSTSMLLSCVVGVRVGCISAVHTTGARKWHVFSRRSIYLRTGRIIIRALYAQHHLLVGIFPALPYSRLRYFITSTPLYSNINRLGSMRRTLCSKLHIWRAWSLNYTCIVVKNTLWSMGVFVQLVWRHEIINLH